MKDTKKTVIFAVVAGVMLGSAVVGNAVPISQTKAFSGQPNISPTLTFDQFDDSAPGVDLTSVEIIFNLDISGGQLVLDNDASQAASGTFVFGSQGSLSSTDVILLDVTVVHIPADLTITTGDAFNLDPNIGDGPGDFDSTSPDGLLYNGDIASDSSSGLVGAAFFTMGAKGYIGTGTYDITADLIQWLNYGGVSGIEFAVSPVTASGSVEIIYTYVPEPATIAMLGLGSLFFVRKRRL